MKVKLQEINRADTVLTIGPSKRAASHDRVFLVNENITDRGGIVNVEMTRHELVLALAYIDYQRPVPGDSPVLSRYNPREFEERFEDLAASWKRLDNFARLIGSDPLQTEVDHFGRLLDRLKGEDS